MTLTFQTMPPSTNHLYAQRGSARFLKPEVREAKEAMAWEARSQYRGKPMAGALAVTVDLYWADRRKHDSATALGSPSEAAAPSDIFQGLI